MGAIHQWHAIECAEPYNFVPCVPIKAYILVHTSLGHLVYVCINVVTKMFSKTKSHQLFLNIIILLTKWRNSSFAAVASEKFLWLKNILIFANKHYYLPDLEYRESDLPSVWGLALSWWNRRLCIPNLFNHTAICQILEDNKFSRPISDGNVSILKKNYCYRLKEQSVFVCTFCSQHFCWHILILNDQWTVDCVSYHNCKSTIHYM